MSNLKSYRSRCQNLSSAIVFFSLCGWIVPLSVYAQQFDQSYAHWKAKQQAIDAKLASQQIVTPKTAQQSAINSETVGAKISINSATADELMQLNGVGVKKAQAILDYRQQSGGFKQIEELQKVKGIGPALFAKNKNRLRL